MPRHHTIWDADLGRQVDVEFTVAEETARDAEELVLKKEMADAKKAQLARTTLSDRIGADSATLRDVLAYLRAADQ